MTLIPWPPDRKRIQPDYDKEREEFQGYVSSKEPAGWCITVEFGEGFTINGFTVHTAAETVHFKAEDNAQCPKGWGLRKQWCAVQWVYTITSPYGHNVRIEGLDWD